MAMSGFFCQDAYLNKLARLSDEEFGRVMRALMKYHASGEIIELEGFECLAFDVIRDDIDRDEKSYEEKCERNRQNRNGGQRPSTTDNDRQQSSTTVNDRDQYNITKNNKDIEKETPLKGSKEKAAEQTKQEERFNQFWGAYPRKEDKSKAAQYFKRINPDDELLQTMLRSIEAWKKSDQWQDKQYIPHPSTWLNGKRWEDEPPAPRSAKTVVAQQYEQRDYSGVQAALTAEQDDYYARRIREKQMKKVNAQLYEQRDYSGTQDELMAEQDREMEEWLRKEASS